MASILKVDTITGVATAGSIAVTGEGNSTTTNLQQGLAKMYGFSNSGATPDSSFNVASMTDNSTGNYDFNFTSSMSNALYQVSAAATGANKVNGTSTNNTASEVNIQTRDLGSNTLVDNYASPAIHGDLA
tara:strand:- start:1803 stop:2192 length:390 start_codon:yes stop_codon:yes gene_type:complete